MNIEQFIQKLGFNNPSQFRHLINPTTDEVTDAIKNISHFILIEGEHKYHQVMTKSGWVETHNEKYAPPHSLFMNNIRLPNKMNELFGFYNFRDFYKEMATRLPNGAEIVEIGTYNCKSSAFLTRYFKRRKKKATIYTIDIYNGNTVNYWNGPAVDFVKNNRIIRHLGLQEYIHCIPGVSFEVARYFKDVSLDMVYIDGCHRSPIIDKDIKNWYPKVKNGGVLAGHDYNENFPDIMTAVNKLSSEIGCEVTTYRCSSWMLIKP